MSHLNGRIYIDTSTDPDTGISIYDIQRTLGLGNTDIGALIVQGALHKKINMYAKHKPVRWPSQSATYSNTPLLYRGADGKCGIEMPILTHNDFILDTTRGYNTIVNAQDHTYLYPRGLLAQSTDQTQTADEWFRFLDFNEYRSYANLNPFVFDYPQHIYKKGAYFDLEERGYQTDRAIKAFEYQTLPNVQNAYELALLDIMSRFSYIYDYNAKIVNGNSCGYIGILMWSGFEANNTSAPRLFLRSHSIIANQTTNYISITPTSVGVLDDIVPALGQQVLLVPCIPNYDSEDAWIDTQSLNSLEIILFDKAYPSYKSYTVEQYLFLWGTLAYHKSNTSVDVTIVSDYYWTVPRNSQASKIGIQIILTATSAPYAPDLTVAISGGVMDGQTRTFSGTYNSSTGTTSYFPFGGEIVGADMFTYSTPSIPESVTLTISRVGNNEYPGNKDSFGSMENRELQIVRLGV